MKRERNEVTQVRRLIDMTYAQMSRYARTPDSVENYLTSIACLEERHKQLDGRYYQIDKRKRMDEQGVTRRVCHRM